MQAMNALAIPTSTAVVKILNFLVICEEHGDYVAVSIFAGDWYIARLQIAMAKLAK